MATVLQCEVCGGDFEVVDSRADDAKYCSQDCYGESLSGKNEDKYTIYECGHCGDTFEALKSRDRDYCSGECQSASQKNRVTLECAICGDGFEVVEAEEDRRVCCSHECMGKYRSEHYTGENHHNYSERAETECHTCGATLELVPSRFKMSDRHFCDHDCYADFISDHISGENHYKWTPEEDKKYGPGWNDKKKEQVRERDNRECQICGSESNGEKLDVHHIQPANTFDDPEKRNDPENLITLCRSCHLRIEKFAPLLPQT